MSEVEKEFEVMVKALVKSGNDILGDLTPEKTHLIHMALGVAGESGELVDAVKKAAVYQKQLDLANVIEEVGDLYFYLEGIQHALGFTREDAVKANITKLNKRYSKGTYSNDQAVERADKND